jgi:hypothetical protein
MKIKELTQAELNAIADILDELEQQAIEEGFANHSDDFVRNIYYDNDYIDVELRFGEQTEQYRVDRQTMELIINQLNK